MTQISSDIYLPCRGVLTCYELSGDGREILLGVTSLYIFISNQLAALSKQRLHGCSGGGTLA